jgi:hypothetical protein
VANENHGLGLGVDDMPGRVDVGCTRERGVLDDTHGVAIRRQLLVDALPAGAVYETAVDEDDGPGEPSLMMVSFLG